MTNNNTPQVIHDLDFEAYREIPAINASGLKLIERSPAHYQAAIAAPDVPTPAQMLGTVTHLLLLQPEREKEVRVIPDCDRRTKAGKEAWAAFQEEAAASAKILVSSAIWEAAQRMRDAALAHPIVSALISDGAPEVTLLAEMDEVAVKGRLDWVPAAHDVIVDLKTAANADEEEFARAIGRYAYHLQAAFYTDLAEICGLRKRVFIFVVVENEPPHGVCLYTLDEAALHAGRVRYQRALATYKECLATGQWPGYPQQIRTINLPKWTL